MNNPVKILVINPGSTSTKIAVYQNAVEVFKISISHSADDLSEFNSIVEQYELRKNAVLECLLHNNFDIKKFDAIVARGGALLPIKGGAYRINKAMTERLRYRPVIEHASNVAPLIAYELSEKYNIPSYIYDAICVDELADIARISGMSVLPRDSMCHVLNMRAVARKTAQKHNRSYDEMNIIVAHIGGGVTLSMHSRGKIIDIVSDDEGPFSADRAGRVSCRYLIDLCYSGKYDFHVMRKMLRGKGGLVDYLGTSSAIEVEEMVVNGDVYAKLVYEAMAYQIAKSIGELATVVAGNVDMIVLTGGIAYSQMITDWITKRVRFIAPVEIIAGENELESLALGCLRVLRDEEKAHEYDIE